TDRGVRNIFRQHAPGLPDHGRYLKARQIDVLVLIKGYLDTSPAITRFRTDFANTRYTVQHRFQVRSRFNLNRPRRTTKHGEAYGDMRQGLRRSQFYRQQGNQSQSDQRQASEDQNNSERRYFTSPYHALIDATDQKDRKAIRPC